MSSFLHINVEYRDYSQLELLRMNRKIFLLYNMNGRILLNKAETKAKDCIFNTTGSLMLS